MFLKLVHGDRLAHDNVGLEVYAHLAKVLNFHVNDSVRETEFRNTVLQYAADFVQSLKYIDVITLLGHIASE